MAFDPDAYLRGVRSSDQPFDPDNYLKGIGVQPPEEEGFFDRFLQAARPEILPEAVEAPVQGQASEEAKTQNPFMGAVARTAGLAGAALEVPDTLAQLMSNLTGLPKDQVFELPIDTVGKRFADKALDYEKDIGYSPSTELGELADNPLNAVPFIAERVVTSIPDMAAALAAAPAYFAARTNEILKSRVENDGKTLAQATVGDVSAAASAAAFETLFERFATKRLLPGAGALGKTAPGRIAKETGVQSGTEFAEEFGTYTAETAGTKRGFDLEEAALAGLEGAIVGGGLGSTVQATKEGVEAYRRARDQEPPVEPEIEPEPITPEDIEAPPEAPVPEEIAAPLEAPVAAAPAPAAPATFPKGVIGSYTNPLDETSAEIIATPDNRFAVRLIDLATGQSMDGGTFETADEANSMAASAIGMSVKPLTQAGAPTTPTQVTPTTPAAGTTPTAPAGETPPTLPSEVTTTIKPPEFSPEEQQALANYFQGQIPDAETIFQNRDRSGKGSIAQMQKIAAAPDYSLVGPSKVLAEGAPVIISDVQIPDRLRGRLDTATASNGQRFPVQYAVVPASELTASNMADGTVNPLYGDMNVPGLRAIAGNGRIAGIQEAYRRKTTEPYVAELMSDTSHGITPEQIASVPNPVLVRIIPKSLVPANIGDLSNVSGIAGLEPVDRAKNDLKRLAGKFDITGLQFTEEGNPQLSTLRQFIQAMPESEQSELINKSTGLPNPDASSRLMNAIFYGAYENDALIDLYAATTNPDAKMYLNSLARVAPKMVKLAGTGDYDIRNKVVEGIENLVSAVRQGVPIKEMPTFVKQGAIGLDPYAQKIMEFIADSGRSTKRIAEGLSRLADASMAASQISQEPDMFGQVPPRPSLDQVFESLKEIELEPDLDLFGTTPTDTTPTDETKKPPPPPPPKEAPKETPGEVSMEIKKNAETIFKEIENLDMQGLAQWTVDNAPNEMLKEVARKSKQRIDDFAARNIQMDKVILSNARRRKGSRGSVSYASSRTGFKFVLTLNGLVNGKEAPVNGLRYQTILHELIHAVTMVQTMNYPKSNENIKSLSSLRTLLRKRYREDVENKTLSADLVWKLKFAFKDIDELMAWGITDKDVQGYLKQVRIGPKFTAFGRLVDIARKILGLGPNSQTALESLLSTTDKLLSSPIQEVEKEIAPGRPPISRISPESPEKMVEEIRKQQVDMFGKDAQTLSDLDQELPKAKKKLPPGRSPELAAMAELLRDGKITKQDFDAAVNKYRPIPLYAEPLEPATDKQVVDALSSDKKPDANIDIPTGTKVGLRLDIPAWNNHKTFVVSIHEGRPKITSASPGKVIGYRSVAVAKNVTFGLGNQRKALDIAAGGAKDALQTMEGEYVNVSPSDAFEMAKKAFKDDRYIQLGFDPTRHSYFYDRKTTKPVVKADAILQIGNMILARGVEYGEKFGESFLYNIDESQVGLFNDANTNPPKVEVKLPPGRSKELADLAQKIQSGLATREEYDAAVNRIAPIYVFTSAKQPATTKQMTDALNVVQREKVNAEIPDGSKVGSRLDIDAKRKHDVAVVVIHEPKPTITAPAAKRALSYRSTVVLKNVEFGIGKQENSLDIAAGKKKNSLQTMEGTLVDMSPEEAFKKAERAMKDSDYIQVGFDPIRHSYFYDRVTTIPVIGADEVIQIGDMVLAKNPKFGRKDQFLYNIGDAQGDMFSDQETKALKQTDDVAPSGKKVVTKNRSPELTAAAQQLSRGEITKEEYEAAVQRFSPVSVYAEPPKPASNAQVVEALDANKKKDANVNIESGTKVGLRLDIPAWENKKTWVVAIHEGKPKITSPKADKILSYRSVAGLKNVVFGIGNQAKTLAIAAGEFKDKLQTMEGEYVNISPDEAYRRAQELIKDPAYIQVGFNPLRHAYFYDRRTMLPVVQAEEVLQIGNLILAKNATYGSKDDFLFDINSTPEMTEEQIDTGITESRDEQIAEYARLRARRAKLIQDVIGGGASIEVQRELTNVDALAKALKEDIDATYVPSRSPEMFLKRALEAFDKGEMSAEVLATIQDAYNKTPFILNGLRLSIRTKKDEGSREIGNFSPIGRIVTLWTGTKGTESPGTIRHELTHSLEQMMTPEQRKVIVDAWKKAFLKAVDKNKDPQSRLYFKKVLQFLDTPSKESFAAATAAMPSFEFYQYMNPSEYWAVNAETLMSAQLGTAWNRFVKAVKKLLESLKNVFGFDNKNSIHKVFDQLMKDKPKPMGINALADYVMGTGARPATLSNIGQNVFGQPMPEASWGRPDDSKMDDVIYTLQDKMVDTKRVVDEIKKSGKSIADKWNPYLQEELYHGRTATKTTNFLKDELEPLMNEIRKRGLTMAEVEEYLHNRHAQARNEFNAKRDPKMPDGGSGIMTADAKAYLDGLTQKQKRDFEAVAKLVDGIVDGTQKLLVETGQESQATIDAWNKALKNYVPLQREETDYDVKNVGVGVGSGFAVKGPFSRAAVGSSKNVIDILANVAMQRERAIVRGEKMRVAKALYGLVLSNPNPGFWLAFDPEAIKKPAETENELVAMGLNPADAKNLVDQPVMRYVDPATNTVVERPNSLLVSSRTSMPVRINGKEKYIIFNAKDPRAERMAEALKNLDADQLGRALSYVQSFTQYFAKINTQYNPIFGVINFARDVQGALLQLSTTPLRNDKKAVFAGVGGALRGIYTEERLRRKGEQPSNNSWAKLWEEFQEEGGQTGFRDQFSRSQERAEALQSILDPSSWTKTPLGQVFTVGGALKVPLETARKVAAPVFDWLSDYNQTMENAIRLSAYKVARDKGMTKQQAASLAKNLTVNFNRKGQIGRQAGALYAFFNAAVQGTTRMLETLRGPAGQKIIYGGLLLGSAQAMMLAAFGFDEDEPPEFVKERNIVIPTGGSKYITIPMPLGYNVIPNTSRILTEWTLSGFKDTHKRVADITGAALDMFNPLGNAGWSAQTFLPTVSDPVVALMENKDWTGKPIAKEDMSSLDPTPGYTRAKETASIISKEMSKFLNAATGGTNYTPGIVSPTPDQIDFLIGQLTGGVGRELLKAEQTVTSQFTGEELPIYKVPLVGRFIGDSEGQAAERNRFYNNLILLNKHERELKGRIKDRVPTKDYLMEYPEARLYSYANQVERNIRTLKKRRDELIEKGAPKEQVKRVENQMTVQMQRFNERVKARANQ